MSEIEDFEPMKEDIEEEPKHRHRKSLYERIKARERFRKRCSRKTGFNIENGTQRTLTQTED